MADVQVLKRDCTLVDFDKEKITNAIMKAMKNGSGIVKPKIAEAISDEIEDETKDKEEISVSEIEAMVFDKLITKKQRLTARAYENYRSVREFQRDNENTIDEDICELLDDKNEYWKAENANKNPMLNTTKRDYMAGIVSTDATRRYLLPPDIVEAHDEGILHFHDADYFAQHMANCCLVNLDDMLQNGTMISGVLIEKPHSFSTACTVTTQIIAQVASSQYGGQTITLTHLAPFVDVSRKKIREEVRREFSDVLMKDPDEHGDEIELIVHDRLQEEITKGIQATQYQLTTIMTTNGQAPFITVFMYLNEAKNKQEKKDLAWIIEEMLKQRMKGVKNEEGVFVAPAFPKLIYVLEEDNITEGSEYWYLTELAAECSSKRLVPDYISEKMMLELKGDPYPCMGCTDSEEVVTYRFNNNLYVESFKRMWNRLSDQYPVKTQANGSDLYMDTDGVEIYDNKNGFVQCQRIVQNYSKNWVRVKMDNGRALTCTPDHPFETENRGVVQAKDLVKKEDIIPIDRKSAFTNGNIPFNTDRAWLFGFLMCDASYAGAIVASINLVGEDDIQNAMIDIFDREYGLRVDVVERDRGEKGLYKDLKVRSKGDDTVIDLCAQFVSMFGGQSKKHRHIPNDTFGWDEESRAAFIAGIIDADGHINGSRGTSIVEIGSTNQELALQQMLLVQSIGIDASVYLNHYKSNQKDAIRYQVSFHPNDSIMKYVKCEKKIKNYSKPKNNPNSIRNFERSVVTDVEPLENKEGYSYDVTTSSEHFTVSGIWSHNCRSFLTPDRFTDAGVGNIAKAKNYVEGEHKYYGRLTWGVLKRRERMTKRCA